MSVVIFPPRILEPHQVGIFSECFPNGQLEIAEESDMSPSAMERFEGYSSRFMPPAEFLYGNFDQFYVVRREENEVTFVAYQTKEYHIRAGIERCLYLYETNEKDSYLGHGEIRLEINNPRPFFKDKPFVGYTFTLDSLRGEGRGTERLAVMNALTQTIWGLPLHSDRFYRGQDKDNNEGAWKSHLRRNLARVYVDEEDSKYHRYCFI